MALDTQVMSYDLTEIAPVERPPVESAARSRQYMGIAVFDGHQWSSLCPELDIASVGSTPGEALARLEEAVRETLRYAQETGRSRDGFAATPDPDLREFLLSRHPASVSTFRPFRA